MDKTKKYWPRLRGLKEMEFRFGGKCIQKYIQKKVLVQDEINILEIGFGEGNCLINLREKFPQNKVKLYGINNIKEGNMYSQKDFYRNAREIGSNISLLNLPIPFFYDVSNGLHFDDNYFDVIISQVCIHYVWDKAKLLEEIWRVLTKGSRAFLHIDASHNSISELPEIMKLKIDTPRMVIYDGNNIISTKEYINNFQNQGYDIKLSNEKKLKHQHNYIITIRKNLNKELDLNLIFDGNSTLSLSGLNSTDKYKTNSEVWWGTRSVFNVKHKS